VEETYLQEFGEKYLVFPSNAVCNHMENIMSFPHEVLGEIEVTIL
jgi:hypothetical protein